MPTGDGIQVDPDDLTAHAAHLDRCATASTPPARPATTSGSTPTRTGNSAR